MAKLITETSFKALIQAIGKKLGQIDTQVVTDKSKLADLETNFGTKAVQAINDELGINILTVKGNAEDANRLLGDLKTAMFGSKEPYKVAKDSDIDTISSHLQSLRSEIQGATAQTGTIVNEYMKMLLGTKNEGGEEVPNDPYIVAKASELETLKGKVDTFFAGATFDREGNNVIDTLKEIVDYLNTNPTGTTTVADINTFKTILKKLSGIENLFDEHGVPNTEKVNEVMSAKEKIDISLRDYAKKSDLDHYLRKIDLQELRLDDAIYQINKHLFDDKRVVTASGDDVNINLNATDPQLPPADQL
jgi:hypothetical protein